MFIFLLIALLHAPDPLKDPPEQEVIVYKDGIIYDNSLLEIPDYLKDPKEVIVNRISERDSESEKCQWLGVCDDARFI